jgi:hypothetical protein
MLEEVGDRGEAVLSVGLDAYSRSPIVCGQVRRDGSGDDINISCFVGIDDAGARNHHRRAEFEVRTGPSYA